MAADTDRVKSVLNQLAGRTICPTCADSFMAALEALREARCAAAGTTPESQLLPLVLPPEAPDPAVSGETAGQ